MAEILLNRFIHQDETALVGRENGKSLRLAFTNKGIDLLAMEQTENPIVIVIPDEVVSVNKSYFLGAFADRVRALGKVIFNQKYQFKTSEHIHHKIEEAIDNALLQATPEQILNV